MYGKNTIIKKLVNDILDEIGVIEYNKNWGDDTFVKRVLEMDGDTLTNYWNGDEFDAEEDIIDFLKEDETIHLLSIGDLDFYYKTDEKLFGYLKNNYFIK